MGTGTVVALYVVAAAAVVVPAVAGPLLAYGAGRRVVGSRAAARARAAVAALVTAAGRPVTALVVVLASAAAVVAVFWPLGLLAHRLEGAVDRPVLAWVAGRRNPSFAHLNAVYTALGDRDPLKVVTVAGAVAIAAFWGRRCWVPLVAILAQFPLEQYVQAILAAVVHRGHPPTGDGTYPSGGVARIVMTFGTLALFAVLTFRLRRPWPVALGTLVAAAAAAEAYSRIYVEKHWLTDALAGLAFGPALFLGYAVAAWVLAGGRRPGDVPAPTAGRPLEPAR
jgi:membrane-associated phospholipid phosphatase